jgi:predicted TIM-barrel fold metal-dependent hydrolase
MRINAHCHVFNFKTFLTQAAKDILAARLNRGGLSKPFAELIVSFIDKRLDRDTDNRTALGELHDMLNTRRRGGLYLWEFLRIGFLPDISAVADDLLAKTRDLMDDPAEDAVVTALMMDVIGRTPSADDALFHDQYRQTVEQALRHPGRVLPFVAYNPDRVGRPAGENGLEIVDSALSSGACVGVKLYPSLAEHGPDSPGMKDLFALCDTHHAPIVMHCNSGGFAASPATALRCYPGDWKPLLRTNQNVRLDFAHFADEDIFTDPKSAPYRWRNMLVDMIKDPQLGGRVYGDVSYQDEPLGRASVRKAYFERLAGYLNDKSLSRNILWGTDYYMIYLSRSNSEYWDLFKYEMGDDFRVIAEANPRRFLGFADAQGQMAPNLARHVEFLRRMSGTPLWEAGSPSAAWLAAAIAAPMTPNPAPKPPKSAPKAPKPAPGNP